MDKLARKYHGRPHWGKVNNVQEQDVAHLYPKWIDFKAMRHILDPRGVFSNDYVRNLVRGLADLQEHL